MRTPDPMPYTSPSGATRYRLTCPECDQHLAARTPHWALDRYTAHINAAKPPADVLAQVPTKDTVRAYPDYYINGCGQVVASQTLCDHGYYLTDSCSICP